MNVTDLFVFALVLHYKAKNERVGSKTKPFFTITAEILARSLANYYCQ